MFFFTYTAAVLTLFFVCAAAFLFFKGKKDMLTHIFILYILADAVWIGGNAIADVSKTDELLILSSGVAFIGSSCIVTFFLIFVDAFVDGKLPSSVRIILYALPSILFTIFSFSEFAVLGTLYPEGQPAQIVPGVQYYFFLLFLLTGLLYALTRLTRLYIKSTGKRKLQTLYITIGFLALFVGGVSFGIVLPLMGELRFYNLAPQFSFILAVTSGYAIYKHKLLDIRIAIQRGIIYTILFSFIVSFYLSIITLTSFLFQQLTPTAIIVNAGITTILGIFTVPHIDRFLRRKTDTLFFKDTYDYADALYELSEKIHNCVLIEDIQKLAEETLGRILKTATVSVDLASKDGLGKLTSKDNTLHRNTLTIPIIFEGNIVGSIFLGEKRSGDPYTDGDVALIRTFSHQIASAFQKAKLYREVEAYSKDLEKRVEERTKEITNMQTRQRQMMLDISHKLQSPLTVVKSQIALFRRTGESVDFSSFEHTIDDISAFVYDLLHLAQLENIPEETLQREEVHLSTLVEELVEYFTLVATQQEITIRSAIDTHVHFRCNKEQMTELITNLVSNAVKYSDHTKQPCFIDITLGQHDNAILLCVSDNGLGISSQDQEHIFERFYRTEATAAIKGTGLGLAICKRIVELHNGTIIARSNEHGGTTFSISFIS